MHFRVLLLFYGSRINKLLNYGYIPLSFLPPSFLPTLPSFLPSHSPASPPHTPLLRPPRPLTRALTPPSPPPFRTLLNVNISLSLPIHPLSLLPPPFFVFPNALLSLVFIGIFHGSVDKYRILMKTLSFFFLVLSVSVSPYLSVCLSLSLSHQ